MTVFNADTHDILVGIVTTVICAAGVLLWRIFSRRASKATEERRTRKRVVRRSAATKWLLSKYVRDAESNLYTTTDLCPGTTIPLYSPHAWHSGPFPLGGLLQADTLEHSPVSHDKKALRAFRKRVPLTHADGTDWNDTVLVANGIAADGQITLGTADYYQFLSTCGALMLETERALAAGPTRTPIRDSLGQAASGFATCPLGAHIIGANVATVLTDGDIHWVLVQERGVSLAVHPGAYNVAPVFGLLAPSAMQSKVDIRMDLVREYLEEFLGYDDVQYATKSRRLDPDWYMRVEEARFLSQKLEDGGATFQIMGVGVDLMNGEVDLACCLHLQLTDFRDEMHKMETNWEYRSIKLYDLMSSELDDLVASGTMQTGGIQSLDLARRWIASKS